MFTPPLGHTVVRPKLSLYPGLPPGSSTCRWPAPSRLPRPHSPDFVEHSASSLILPPREKTLYPVAESGHRMRSPESPCSQSMDSDTEEHRTPQQCSRPSIIKVEAPQRSLAGGMTSSTLETEEPRQSRQGRRRRTISGVTGGRLEWPLWWLVALLGFATVAFALGAIFGTFADLTSSADAMVDAAPAITDGRHITARSGAVAADQGTCSQMGVDRLKAGGNAIDAAGMHPPLWPTRW